MCLFVSMCVCVGGGGGVLPWRYQVSVMHHWISGIESALFLVNILKWINMFVWECAAITTTGMSIHSTNKKPFHFNFLLQILANVLYRYSKPLCWCFIFQKVNWGKRLSERRQWVSNKPYCAHFERGGTVPSHLLFVAFLPVRGILASLWTDFLHQSHETWFLPIQMISSAVHSTAYWPWSECNQINSDLSLSLFFFSF